MSNLSMRFRFNSEKAVDVICFIASNAPVNDIYHICKVLYFADKLHMERYGRSICGDTYIAMKFGPVPSGTYDLIKDVRRHRTHSNNYDHAAASFQLVGDDRIKVIRDVNEDLFSDSDIECLNQSIQEHGSKPFDVLVKETHDEVWQSADENGEISIESIVATLSDSDALLEYLKESHYTI